MTVLRWLWRHPLVIAGLVAVGTGLIIWHLAGRLDAALAALALSEAARRAAVAGRARAEAAAAAQRQRDEEHRERLDEIAEAAREREDEIAARDDDPAAWL